MIELSIVILSYNVRDLLLDCVKSIYEHTRDINFEVIVVDNASTDGSVEGVRKSFPQVRVIVNEENMGFSRGNNVGLRAAQGRAAIILNSDTIIRNNVFKELYTALISTPEIGAVGPRLIYPDGRIQHFCARREENLRAILRLYYIPYFRDPELYLKAPLGFSGLYETEGISGAAMMVKREVLERVGGLDEGFWAYCEDTDWAKRISLGGFKLACLTTSEVIHFHGKGSVQNEKRCRTEAVKSEIRYLHKYGTRLQRVIYRLGIGLNNLLRMLTLDLIRALLGRRQRFVIDWAMFKTVLNHRVSEADARTRESVRGIGVSDGDPVVS